MDNISSINDHFNNSIAYESRPDGSWDTPSETKASGKGDCNSYAIGKFFALKDKGIPAKLAYVQSDQGPHMVVIAQGMVLDNNKKEVLPKEERPDLIPVFQFDDKYIYNADGTKQLNSARNIKKWARILDSRSTILDSAFSSPSD